MERNALGKTPVVILGAGGTSLYMAETVDRTDTMYFLGFLDDSQEKQNDGYCGRSVLGPLNSWGELPKESLFLSSLFGPKKTPAYFQIVQSLRIPRSRWATVVDPHSCISPTATLEPGSFMAPGTIIEPMARIGRMSILIGNVYVAHHSRLEDYVCCANCVSIAGAVTIGTQTYVGANSTIREYVAVGGYSVVGMGSVVVGDIPGESIIVGNPARIVGSTSRGKQGIDAFEQVT